MERPMLTRCAAAHAPRLAARGWDGGLFPTAHAVGCTDIAPPVLHGEICWQSMTCIVGVVKLKLPLKL